MAQVPRPLRDIADIEEEAEAVGNGMPRAIFLYVIVLLGVAANAFLPAFFAYRDLPEKQHTAEQFFTLAGLYNLTDVVLYFVFYCIVGGIIFYVVYTRINVNTSSSGVIYFLAFQNGALWPALISQVTATMK
jgi:hypothetical protein